MDIQEIKFEQLNPEIFHILMEDMAEKCGQIDLNNKKIAFALLKDGEVCGGVTGTIDFQRIHVNGLGMDKSLRGQDYGTKLMDMLEEAAIKEGVKLVTLSTLDFQALGFYEKRGYKVFGVINDCPYIGRTEYHLSKRL